MTGQARPALTPIKRARPDVNGVPTSRLPERLQAGFAAAHQVQCAPGYETPTPIQAEGHPAGPGRPRPAGRRPDRHRQDRRLRPAAAAAPGRQRSRRGPRKPRALVLVPTRELAVQVHDSLRGYSKYLRIPSHHHLRRRRHGHPQHRRAARGVDMLVATPGRLIDHMDRASSMSVEMLVLDEADRMLDMGFLPAIKRILAKLPKQNRQTLLFSATFEDASSSWRRSSCVTRSRCRSRRATPSPRPSPTACIRSTARASATCCCILLAVTPRRSWSSARPSTAANKLAELQLEKVRHQGRPRSTATRARRSACAR
jgi:hypothetical protein